MFKTHKQIKCLLIAAQMLSCYFWTSELQASPIYVIRERGGVIRFSTNPPKPGVVAEVFTSKGSTYSVIGNGYRFSLGKIDTRAYNETIIRAAKIYQVDPSLLRAVIHAESGFNPRAVSPKGAIGLMQLMPETAKMHGVTTPFEPTQNIYGGARHLALLLRKYSGNLSLTLAAYNAGEEAVSRYGGVPPYSETQEYVKRVQMLKRRYGSSG